MQEARFVDVNSDALVQQKFNRPVQSDPLGLGQEVYTGHVWGRRGQMTAAKPKLGGGRHHVNFYSCIYNLEGTEVSIQITAMARSSAMNHEALLARAAAKRGNKDTSRGRYGW
jgi:hypothetical protein